MEAFYTKVIILIFSLFPVINCFGQNQKKNHIIIPDSLLILNKNLNFTTYNPEKFDKCWGSYPGAQLVDVRTEQEYQQGYIADAINIDMKKDNFIQIAESKLDKSKPVAVYCKGGIRSRMAAKKLLERGFMVYNLEYGYDSWLEYIKK